MKCQIIPDMNSINPLIQVFILVFFIHNTDEAENKSDKAHTDEHKKNKVTASIIRTDIILQTTVGLQYDENKGNEKRSSGIIGRSHFF